MAWPATTALDVFSGKGAKTLGQNMYDRRVLVASMGWSWVDSEQIFTTSLVDEFGAVFLMPPWTEATAVISLTFVAKTSGAGSANFRLRGREEGGSYVNGGTLNQALTAAYVPYTTTLTVPASPSWAGVNVEFGLQAQNPGSGGSWRISLERLVANMWVTPI